MNRFLTMRRLSILFFGIFGVLVAGTVVFQNFWVAPGERCEKAGNWYDIESRTCATPIYIPDITGRPAGVTRAEASNEKNRELIDLEAQVTRQQIAVNSAVAKSRAELEAQNQR